MFAQTTRLVLTDENAPSTCMILKINRNNNEFNIIKVRYLTFKT